MSERAMALSDNGPRLLGFDIGGTKTAVVVGTPDGRVVERLVFPSHAEQGPAPLLDQLERHGLDLMSRHRAVRAVGVSIGGPVDVERGLVLSPPNLPGWDAVPLVGELRRRLRRDVAIEHDAKACALAEWRYGAGRGCSDMVFLTLGTGIGAGIVCGGRLVRGSGNLAGEIGHWRVADDGPDIYGKRGSLEGWCSGAGLGALASHLAPAQFTSGVSAADLGRRAAEGDAAAGRVIGRAGEALGRVLALLVDLLAPEAIVLGNLAARLGDGFLEPARRVLAQEALPALAGRCRVVGCALGESIGDMAALSVAAGVLEASLSP